jgi:hypothetical protein
MNIDDIDTPISTEYRINSIVALLIDIVITRAESHITRAICAIRAIHNRDGFSIIICQNRGDDARKYAVIPVTVRAAAICIYRLFRSVETALDVAVPEET